MGVLTDGERRRNRHTIKSMKIENALMGTLPATDIAEATVTQAQPASERMFTIHHSRFRCGNVASRPRNAKNDG